MVHSSTWVLGEGEKNNNGGVEYCAQHDSLLSSDFRCSEKRINGGGRVPYVRSILELGLGHVEK